MHIGTEAQPAIHFGNDDEQCQEKTTTIYVKGKAFPKVIKNRNLVKNRDLILTALLIYKQGYMTVGEIKNVMDLFKRFTMSKGHEE